MSTITTKKIDSLETLEAFLTLSDEELSNITDFHFVNKAPGLSIDLTRIQALGERLAKCKNLVTMQCENIGFLNVPQSKAVFDAIAKCPALQSFNLSQENINNWEGDLIDAFYEFLPRLKALRSLDLSTIELGRLDLDVFNKFCATLLNCKELEKIHFFDYHSRWLDENLEALYATLTQCKNLKEINLSNSRFSFFVANGGRVDSLNIKKLFDGLKKISDLQGIDLEFNELGKVNDQCFDALCTGLQSIEKLFFIKGIDKNGLTTERIERLNSIVEQHRRDYNNRITEAALQLPIVEGLTPSVREKILGFAFSEKLFQPKVQSADKAAVDLLKKKKSDDSKTPENK